MFSLIYAWINDWVNNREVGDLRRQHGHHDVIVMKGLTFSDSISVRCLKAAQQPTALARISKYLVQNLKSSFMTDLSEATLSTGH